MTDPEIEAPQQLPIAVDSPSPRTSSEALLDEQGPPSTTTHNPSGDKADKSADDIAATKAELIEKLTHFLATASPTTLSAVAVGIAATTYVILGRIGLILIGAVGGVALYASFETRTPQQYRKARSEVGAELLQRLLDAGPTSAVLRKDSQLDETAIISTLDDFSPQTREALNALIDAAIRDYVKSWYTPVVPTDRSFSLACRRALTNYIISISNHLSRKRPADVFLDFVTNSVSMIVVFISELSAAFAEIPSDSKISATDVVYGYLAENPDSNLANLLNQKQQTAKLKTIAEDLLTYVDKPIFECDPTRIFLREILSSVILEKTLLSCSRPEWINGWIVSLLEAGEPDFSQAIDVGMQAKPDAGKRAASADPDNSSETTSARGSLDKDRRHTMAHKKKLSKADEEMEEAIQEMRRMNQMIADEQAIRSQSFELPGTPKNGSEPGVTCPSDGDPTSDHNKAYSLVDTDSTPGEIVRTPTTPASPEPSASNAGITEEVPVSMASGNEQAFVNFDQMMPTMKDLTDEEVSKKVPLTLHNATITVHDDDTDNTWKILGKPNWEYLVQVEPASPHNPGWMVVRRYSDFESLHEILRRIATVSGASSFVEQHAILPSWKDHTRQTLRTELERYLRDSCWYQSLAESEGMKRFLDKDQGMPKVPEKSLFGWNAMGGMLDAVADAPKGALQGSKAVVGGLFGSIGNLGKRQTQAATPSPEPPVHDPIPSPAFSPPAAVDNRPRMSLTLSPTGTPGRPEFPSPGMSLARASLDSTRSSIISVQPGKIAPMERRPSHQSIAMSPPPIPDENDAAQHLKLPPPPDQMTEDAEDIHLGLNKGDPTSPLVPSPLGPHAPLNQSETRVAVELVFAVFNELYTLSSAWNFRRTLLAAAKSFLLRPNNPSLIAIQEMMQTSVLDNNSSDTGIAAHLIKLRENAIPTAEEAMSAASEMTDEEKEKLRAKAKRLLIQSGVPGALKGVMGQGATSDAMGRLFDCLQMEEVAREGRREER
ncbi:PXA domain protein [Ceratocystis platani]|uniref:PXA domain protein n=1 Tax=Ceratocystis fimbriata f. sp. platani TaxID=88771 RepID=A0A0F8CR85_CERFI|nr:PXA domain protein [Ceratocystis platani]